MVEPSKWVLEMVSSFRHLVGVSCVRYEPDLIKLFAALKMERSSGSKSPGKSESKMIRELKSLKSSVNYDVSAFGEGLNEFSMKPRIILWNVRGWGGSHVKWCCLEAEGASGGILCVWDSRILELV